MDEIMGKIAVLQSVKLFKDLTIDVLQEIANRVQRRKITQNETIFQVGDIADAFYVISSGQVIIKEKGASPLLLQENDFFGEAALICSHPRTQDAICQQEGIALLLDKETFLMLISSFPEILLSVTNSVLKNLEHDRHQKELVLHPLLDSLKDKKTGTSEDTEKKLKPNNQKNIEILHHIPLFKGLCDDDLESILPHIHHQRAGKNEIIFNEGDRSNRIYIVSKGSILIKNQRKELAVVTPYDFFGELGLMSEKSRLASAIAKTDSNLLYMSKKGFNHLLSFHPFIAKSILFKIVSYRYSSYQLDHKEEIVSIENQLPGYDHATISHLFFERIGLCKNSNMTVVRLNEPLRPSHAYCITEEGIREANNSKTKRIVLDKLPSTSQAPKHLEIEGIWDSTETFSGEEGNILGGNGKFIINTDKIVIPVVEATAESLAYYQAKLISCGESFLYPGDVFPIWDMIIGEKYVEDFIMTPKGGGLYIEYHNDKPHFHIPADKNSHGYYLLGKKITNRQGKNIYRLMAFKIPYGKGVYTANGVIHCDACLKGNWFVGYANAKDFSTVLLRDHNDMMVEVEFLEI